MRGKKKEEAALTTVSATVTEHFTNKNSQSKGGLKRTHRISCLKESPNRRQQAVLVSNQTINPPPNFPLKKKKSLVLSTEIKNKFYMIKATSKQAIFLNDQNVFEKYAHFHIINKQD